MCVFEAIAQKYADEFRPKHFGVNISTLSGFGLSFINDLSYWDNIKTVVFMCSGIDGESFFCTNEDDFKFNVGLEYQRDIVENTFLRFYATLGGSFTNLVFEFTECHSLSCSHFNRGIGLGLDLELFKKIAFNVHKTYQYTNTYGKSSMSDHGFGWGLGITFHLTSY